MYVHSLPNRIISRKERPPILVELIRKSQLPRLAIIALPRISALGRVRVNDRWEIDHRVLPSRIDPSQIIPRRFRTDRRALHRLGDGPYQEYPQQRQRQREQC